jgi:hypothetical protein
MRQTIFRAPLYHAQGCYVGNGYRRPVGHNNPVAAGALSALPGQQLGEQDLAQLRRFFGGTMLQT